jgi:hypothetical protein
MGFNVQFFNVANANTYENDRITKREIKKKSSAMFPTTKRYTPHIAQQPQQLVRLFSKPDELSELEILTHLN